ncbi:MULTISPECIES: flagellar biosynthesis protein FlhF [Pseudomonas]|uniref:Flagellar biosynthesis protein FlhF n=1 Tax=Pseudomonas flexibilis TaxID=706570 RepID=A0A1N6TK97_9PSED|nr:MULTISPECIES: flagellar biosynthesis protein FlhF [Pseudomonas]KHL69871.1 flagellar biosynthesis regulator FlhF [Pseudomonas flexibilis]SIQ53516.1 flagellar biosynthesis protein FlhF [Pseudomonas flexibilis]
MQVKRFFAADMRQAMKLVRDELGADAAIIGNRRLAGGVELVAALNYQLPNELVREPNLQLEAELRKTQEMIASAQVEMAIRSESEQTQPAPVAPVAPPAPRRDPESTEGMLDAVRSELTGLRELIEMQLGTMVWGNIQENRPLIANLWRRMQRIGLPVDVSKKLMDEVSDETDSRRAWRIVLAHLARSLIVPEREPLEEGGVIALVGPAGMGKTTTLAKMAARYVLKHGAKNIALVSMDGYRIGAQEQLKTLGKILNVPVTQVEPGESLIEALEPLRKKRLVLIDTAGLPTADPALRQQLDALAAADLNARNYLVLAATSQEQVLRATYQSYKRCGLAGCVITKLDEALSLGEILGVLVSEKLPLAYLADGPRIPDDLHTPRSHQLVSRAVRMQMSEDPSEDLMADMFAGLYNNTTTRRVG